MTTTHESQMLEALAAFEAGDWGLGLSMLTELKKTLTARTDEMRLREARDAIERDYYETVRSVTDEIADEWCSGGFKGSRDSLMQSIEESSDARCTYTSDCQFYLAVTRNDAAYIEVYGSIADNGDSFPWSALASCAMRQDIIEDLENQRDIDVNDDPPDEPVVHCNACSEWKPGRDAICNDCADDEVSEDDSELDPPATDGPSGDADR